MLTLTLFACLIVIIALAVILWRLRARAIDKINMEIEELMIFGRRFKK